jgi:hypothetical protein
VPGNIVKSIAEAERMEIIHARQRELAHKIKNPPRILKAGELTDEEIEHKKDMAVLLRLSGMTPTEIAGEIRMTKGTVRGWFNSDPYTKGKYYEMRKSLLRVGTNLLERYQAEAITTLVTLMRFGSEQYMFQSATALMDRGGLPKVSKSEVTSEKEKVHKWDENSLMADFEWKNMTDEEQYEFAAIVESMEKLGGRVNDRINKPQEEDLSP